MTVVAAPRPWFIRRPVDRCSSLGGGPALRVTLPQRLQPSYDSVPSFAVAVACVFCPAVRARGPTVCVLRSPRLISRSFGPVRCLFRLAIRAGRFAFGALRTVGPPDRLAGGTGLVFVSLWSGLEFAEVRGRLSRTAVLVVGRRRVTVAKLMEPLA
jgi:hypothetical protein